METRNQAFPRSRMSAESFVCRKCGAWNDRWWLSLILSLSCAAEICKNFVNTYVWYSQWPFRSILSTYRSASGVSFTIDALSIAVARWNLHFYSDLLWSQVRYCDVCYVQIVRLYMKNSSLFLPHVSWYMLFSFFLPVLLHWPFSVSLSLLLMWFLCFVSYIVRVFEPSILPLTYNAMQRGVGTATYQPR